MFLRTSSKLLRGIAARPLSTAATGGARRFDGKVAVVTGAGRDIGRATAARFAAEGASVVLHYHSSDAGARQAADEINGAGGRAVTVQADLATEAGADAVAAAARELGDEIHALVHNSGGLVERRTLGEPVTIIATSLEHFVRIETRRICTATARILILARCCSAIS